MTVTVRFRVNKMDLTFRTCYQDINDHYRSVKQWAMDNCDSFQTVGYSEDFINDSTLVEYNFKEHSDAFWFMTAWGGTI